MHPHGAQEQPPNMRGTRPAYHCRVLLTVKQAAERLGVHPSLVRKLCAEGRIRASRFGKAWIIKPEALEKYQAIPRRGSVNGKSSPELKIKAASRTRRKYARNT